MSFLRMEEWIDKPRRMLTQSGRRISKEFKEPACNSEPVFKCLSDSLLYESLRLRLGYGGIAADLHLESQLVRSGPDNQYTFEECGLIAMRTVLRAEVAMV